MDYKDKVIEFMRNKTLSTEEINKLEEIFPELKGNGDDRIRKALVDTFKFYTPTMNSPYLLGIDKKDILAWLEKQKVLTTEEYLQGKEEALWCIKQAKKHAKDENEMGTCWFAEKWIEKQGEQKLADTDNKFIRMRETKPKDISEFLDRVTFEEQEFLWEYIAKIRELVKEEQNPADKVEPKFHEGEWVVNNTTLNSCRIVKVEHGQYICDDCSFPITKENEYHLWTIQDAKDGDVLFQDLMGGKTFIYNGVNPDMAILYSFIISNDDEDVLPYHIGKPNTGIGNIEENKNIIHPATKEQCNILFQKMYEAGYRWNAEKKELKKIEQNTSQWNILDYRTWQYIVSDVLTKRNGIGQYLDDVGCKNLAKYMQEEWGKKLSTEKKPTEWSEEDERMYRGLYNLIYSTQYCDSRKELSDWLESLKDRVQTK